MNNYKQTDCGFYIKVCLTFIPVLFFAVLVYVPQRFSLRMHSVLRMRTAQGTLILSDT